MVLKTYSLFKPLNLIFNSKISANWQLVQTRSNQTSKVKAEARILFKMVVERQPLLSRVSTLHSIVKVWKHHKDATLVAKSLSKINILEAWQKPQEKFGILVRFILYISNDISYEQRFQICQMPGLICLFCESNKHADI